MADNKTNTVSNQTNMVGNEIIFRMGEETGIVIEKTQEQFEQSIFKEQYKQALLLVNDIMSIPENYDENAPESNIIAFCGERGEGKTSALMSVRNILAESKAFNAAKEANLFPKKHDIKETSFKVLNLVDPAFFDGHHNILELLLGQMYAEVLSECKNENKDNTSDCDFKLSDRIADRNRLMQRFQEVRSSLSIISKPSNTSAYDNLEEIDELAAGLVLKKKFNNLLHCYAKYFYKERVLICIDDLDLNVSEGYKMAEEIRKYLCSPKECVVLMAIKVEQMIDVVKSYLRKRIDKIVIDDEIADMATRYVTKLIPESHRVIMPKGENIVETAVTLKDQQPKDEKETKKGDESYTSVKEAVVRLIYKKTGYIFINGRNISPIVPLNLRSVRLLLGMLWKMPNSRDEDGSDNLKNKADFKAYFNSSWKDNLSKSNLIFVDALVRNEDIISINKDVVSHLGNILQPKVEEKVTEISDSIVTAILHPNNAMQNISLGDVFYVMNYVENVNASAETKHLVYFLRAFYSMKLYETYNVISESEAKLFPKEEENVAIYKYDTKIQKLNILQRLINGSYFTYEEGDLMPADNRHIPRDKRAINGKALCSLFKSLSPESSDLDWQLCEFFALTTRYPLYSRQNLEYDRTQTTRSYFDAFSDRNNYIAFDALSIFNNVVNIKQAYQRWNDLYKGGTSDFFKDSLTRDKSLLKDMLSICAKKHNTTKNKLEHKWHCFISEATIRFSEVQLAVVDKLINKRDSAKTGGNLFNIANTYQYIRDLGIKLYPNHIQEEKDSYDMEFWFLKPVIEFLNPNKTILTEEIFNSIYQLDVTTQSIRNALETVFGKTILKKKQEELTGIEIRNIIEKQKDSDIYENINWEELFDETTKYSREDIIAILSEDKTYNIVRQVSRSILERERITERVTDSVMRRVDKEMNATQTAVQNVLEPLSKQIDDLASRIDAVNANITEEGFNRAAEIERIEKKLEEQQKEKTN